MKYVIVGTAGHIDHGKTALVKAITGIDTDRLPEEKKRGITIDIGFAHWKLSEDLALSFIDVPGHERLVKNMIAGACGIDMVLLVVAADEGVMPQTVEHLNICRILGIKHCIVALNKADKVDETTLELALEDVRDFLAKTPYASAPIVPVSAKTGFNINALVDAIRDVALKVEPRSSIGPFRLPVDRVFTVKGFGTVVTGTVFSGKVSVGDTVEVLPVGKRAKVRNIQVRGENVDSSHVGLRTALNLHGVEKDELERGVVVASPDAFSPSTMLDVKLFLLEDARPLADLAPVRVHVATKEATGRAKLLDRKELLPGEECYCRIHLDEEVVAVNGEAFVLRSYSPVFTIGGGVILDACPSGKRIKRSQLAERLKALEGEDDRERISLFLKWASKGLTRDELKRKCIDPWKVDEVLESLLSEGLAVKAGPLYMHRDTAKSFVERIEELVKDELEKDKLKGYVGVTEISHKVSLSDEAVAALAALSERLEVSSKGIRLKGQRELDEESRRLVGSFERLLINYGLKPPNLDRLFEEARIPPKDRGRVLKYLTEQNRVIRVSTDIVLHKKWADHMVSKVNAFFDRKKELSVGEFKDMLGISRKYAIPYLEFLDKIGITKRVGNIRTKR